MEAKAQILNLLRGAARYPHTRAEILRRLKAEPGVYLPLMIAVAIEDRTETGETAARLVTEFLEQHDDLKLNNLARALLPVRTTRLNSAAMLVRGRLLAALKREAPTPDREIALLSNDLSEFLALDGQTAEALKHAAEAVRQFRLLVRDDAKHRPDLALALNTLAKRLVALQQLPEAIAIAREAVGQAKRLVRENPQAGPLMLAQSQTNLANRFAALGDQRKSLKWALAACAGLAALAAAQAPVREDWAIASLTCANRLIELGDFETAQRHARKAHEIFRSLVAGNSDHYLEFYLAAGNSLSICLAFHGQPQAAAQVASQYLKDLRALSRQSPRRFLRDYVTCLVNYSASQGESGQIGEALRAAYLALRAAQRLGRVLGARDLVLEGTAFNNLFNREYDRGACGKAAGHAQKAVERFELAVAARPELRLDLARAWRNLSEGLRLTARSRAPLVRATRAAIRALREIEKLPEPRAETVIQMHAYCLGTLALCLTDAGRPRFARRALISSVAQRRLLFRRSPKIYRPDYASGLYLLAGLELDRGQAQEALRLATESVRQYTLHGKRSEDHVSIYLSEALDIKTRALVALNRPKLALRCLSKRIELLRRLAELPKGFKGRLRVACRVYEELARAVQRADAAGQ